MMAVDLHNAELLLPSKFFTEEDRDVLSVSNSSNQPINRSPSCLFGSSDSGSDLSSPVDSELGSAENSEEEDDYIAELTRQMAHYMLQDEDKHDKLWGLAGSPQSTLWSPQGSNHESPTGPSREPSPPLTPMIGKFEKMAINEEKSRCNHGERILSTPTSVPVTTRNQDVEFHSKQALIEEQIRTIQFYRLKQEQAMKHMEQKQKAKLYQSKGRACGGFNSGHKGAAPNPWYALQQKQSNQQHASYSDMSAVFLNASGSGTGSCGTGVFLPRGVGTGTACESRKKPGCSTVLIPARVVQALKLHFEKMGVPSRFNGGFPLQLQHDALGGGRNGIYSQQKRQPRSAPAMNQEMDLPQEWTY